MRILSFTSISRCSSLARRTPKSKRAIMASSLRNTSAAMRARSNHLERSKLWASARRERTIAVLVSCLTLILLVTTSTRLYSQDWPSSTSVAATVPKGDFSPSQPAPLVQELPYCELGYGPCGGECSSEEGKKKWNCSANTLPCHHEGQRCTCETADMCKPKKKKPEHSP